MSQEKAVKNELNGQSQVEGQTVEVVPTAKRRQFSEAYKKRILAEIDGSEKGQTGAILRREGLYSSYLTDWRRQQKEATNAGRGRPSKSKLEKEMSQLRQESEALKRRLEQAEMIIDIQKKVSQLIGLTLTETGPGENK